MSTTVQKTIAPSGGDYTTLASFEAGEQRDLTAADEIAEALCSNFQDTTSFTFAGWTTDATRYIHVVAADSHGSRGALSTAAYRLVTTGGTTITNGEWVIFDGIQVQNGNGTALWQASSPATTLIARKCIFRRPAGVGSVISVNGVSGSKAQFINCVAIAPASVNAFLVSAGNTAECYNVDAIGDTVGFSISGTLTAKNCYAKGSSTAYGGAGTKTLTTCASSDTTGSAGLQNIPYDATVFVNVTAGSEDLAILSKESALVDGGTDTSGESSPFDFTDDIDGSTRPARSGWDVGIFEFPDDVAPVDEINVGSVLDPLIRVRPTGPVDLLDDLPRGDPAPRWWEAPSPRRRPARPTVFDGD